MGEGGYGYVCLSGDGVACTENVNSTFDPVLIQDGISMWLSILGLSQYEQILLDAGYDDIDFISDITGEELQDIGITKRGLL